MPTGQILNHPDDGLPYLSLRFRRPIAHHDIEYIVRAGSSPAAIDTEVLRIDANQLATPQALNGGRFTTTRDGTIDTITVYDVVPVRDANTRFMHVEVRFPAAP